MFRLLKQNPILSALCKTSQATLNNNLVLSQKAFYSPTAPEQKANQKYVPMNGNQAGSYIAYGCSENSFIYPITPSSPMGELMDVYRTQGKKNVFGKVVQVDMMQSEGGAAGAVHGSLAAGSLCTTFTSSQGLLLKIPNMYMISGELLPTVFYVASRTVCKHAGTIQVEYSDVMTTRQTGFAMIFCTGVQEVMDIGLACHLSTVQSRVPFMCVQDGFRTSHEINNVQPIPYEKIASIWPYEAVEKNVRANAVNPHNPISRAAGWRQDIFFQGAMASQKYYNACPDIVAKNLEEIEKITGRKYKVYEYHGPENPDKVIVIMGSAAQTATEVCDYLNSKEGYNVGVVIVRMFRPWSEKYFMQIFPKSVKKVAVLDRVREEGAQGMPLYLDVNSTLRRNIKEKITVVGGIFGLGGKDFRPSQVKAIYDYLDSEKPKQNFTVGITDDVTFTSIPVGPEINTCPEGTKQCIFWGLGSDGTISANQAVIQNIISNTTMKAQGYFNFDAFKTDGTTISHLRFGEKDIRSHYEITSGADIVSVNKDIFLQKYDLVKSLKRGGILLVNSKCNTAEELEKFAPPKLLREIAEKEIQVYNIDASGIALKIGLRKRINNIMTVAFYKLSEVIPFEVAEKQLRQDVVRLYSKKGEKVIKMNMAAIDHTLEHLVKIEYSVDKWKNAPDVQVEPVSDNPWIQNIHQPIINWKSEDLPVSTFEAGGYLRVHTTHIEKRKIGSMVPQWDPEKCTQCNYCSLVCPHAVIRPYLLTNEEVEQAPKELLSVKAKGSNELSKYNFSIQISSDDCASCELCAQACNDKALTMKPYGEVAWQNKTFQYCYNLPNKQNPIDKNSPKGSQFEKPLLEFSGACSGCNQTPYVKLLTQLYGKNMMLVNATGCSMIWGGWFPSNPYTTIDKRGPPFSHSLFEDNAEYGYGQLKAFKNRVNNFAKEVKEKIIPGIKEQYAELAQILEKWTGNRKNKQMCEDIYYKVCEILEKIPSEEMEANKFLQIVKENKDMITVRTFWFVGGDGWAYDIGYGGIDHILNQHENYNILVLDTELYSNTGGQSSKSTQMGTSVKFSLGGKATFKKDLGRLAMTYGHIYVASIAMGANYNQALQAITEAETYDGPSLVIAMCPCIDWNIQDPTQMMKIQKIAVDSGYWPLYRYDPRKPQPFQLDSKKLRTPIKDFVSLQSRFNKLVANKEWMTSLQEHINKKHQIYTEMGQTDMEKLESLQQKLKKAEQ